MVHTDIAKQAKGLPAVRALGAKMIAPYNASHSQEALTAAVQDRANGCG